MSFNVTELFDGKLTKGGADVPVSAVQNKVVAIYFSAHWCPPCRAFTPTLIAAYNEAKAAGVNFELVFVSADEDEEGFAQYTKDMPWPSVKFEDEDARTLINDKFGVQGIPQLIVLKPDGSILTSEGRSQVAKDKAAAIKAWAA